MGRVYAFLLLLVFCISGLYAQMRNASALRKELKDKMDVHLRPEDRTTVNMTFILTSLNKLDTVSQELATTFLLHLTWTDHRLAWEPQTGELEHLVFYVNEVWTPPLVVSNAIEDAIFLLKDDIVPLRVTNNGTVTWVPRVSPVTTCEIDTSKFPVDSQKCHINITAWSHSAGELDLVESGTDRFQDVVKLQLYNDHAWQLFHAAAVSNNLTSGSSTEFSNIQYTFYFRRHERFYWVLIIIPFCCISFLMALVFLVPSKYQEFKISYSVTLLLSFQMYLTLLQSLLPPVFNEGETHILGEYVAAVMGFGTAITGVLIIQLVVIYFVRRCHRYSIITGSITGTVPEIKSAVLAGNATGTFSKCEPSQIEGDMTIHVVSRTETGTLKTGTPETGTTKTGTPEIGTAKLKTETPEPGTANLKTDTGTFKGTVTVYSNVFPSKSIISGIEVSDSDKKQLMTISGIIICPGDMVGPLKCIITGNVVDNEIKDGVLSGKLAYSMKSLAQLPIVDFMCNMVCFGVFMIVYVIALVIFLSELHR